MITKYALSFVLGAMFIMVLDLIWAGQAYAQGVKYCKNATTGDIITVEENMPCPYPTHEI
jgi:hypothetical protein